MAGTRAQELFNLLAEMAESGNIRGCVAFQGSQASKRGSKSSKEKKKKKEEEKKKRKTTKKKKENKKNKKKKKETDPDHEQQQEPGQQQEQHSVGRKNDKRDLERKLLKNSAWLRGYEAEIPMWSATKQGDKSRDA